MPLALKSLANLNPPTSEVDREAMLTIPPGTSLVLHNINWAGFEKLLLELGDIRAVRITDDHGTLEIYHRAGDRYRERDRSLAFLTFPVLALIALIDDHHPLGKLAMWRAFRAWISREQGTTDSELT